MKVLVWLYNVQSQSAKLSFLIAGSEFVNDIVSRYVDINAKHAFWWAGGGGDASPVISNVEPPLSNG